jgi:transaldolase
LGILDGVTTNPTLIKQAVEDLKKKGESIKMGTYIREILKTARGTPVSLEVIGNTYEEMIEEGKRIFKKFNSVAGNVYIKIPVNPSFGERTENIFDGIKAVKELSRLKIPVNCTLIFTPEQALMAAKAGAKFVSPFAGRVDDYIRSQNNISFKKSDYFPVIGWRKNNEVLEDNGIVSGVDLVNQIAEIFENYDIESEIIAASIRNPRQVREVALAGADIATLPFSVIERTLVHYKTMEGMEKFTRDVVSEYKNLVKVV